MAQTWFYPFLPGRGRRDKRWWQRCDRRRSNCWDSVLPAGADVTLKVQKGKTVLTVKQSGDFIGEVGDPVYLRIPSEAINLYDPETGLLLSSE
jgi:hypothetical protein